MWITFFEENESSNQTINEMNYGGNLVDTNIYLETSLTIPLPFIVSEKIESYEFYEIEALESELTYNLELSKNVHKSKDLFFYYILFEIPFNRDLDKTININSIPLKINDSLLINYTPSMFEINPPKIGDESAIVVKDAPVVIHELYSTFSITMEVKESVQDLTVSFSNPNLQIEYINGKEYQAEKFSLSKGVHNIELSLKSELSNIELYHSNIIFSYLVEGNERENVMHWHTSLFDINSESILYPMLDSE